MTVKVPKDVHRKFKILCASTDRTMSEVVVKFVQKEVERQERQEKSGTA